MIQYSSEQFSNSFLLGSSVFFSLLATVLLTGSFCDFQTSLPPDMRWLPANAAAAPEGRHPGQLPRVQEHSSGEASQRGPWALHLHKLNGSQSCHFECQLWLYSTQQTCPLSTGLRLLFHEIWILVLGKAPDPPPHTSTHPSMFVLSLGTLPQQLNKFPLAVSLL